MSRTEDIARKAMTATLAGLSRVAPPLAGRLATYLWFTPFPLARAKALRLPSGARAITHESAGEVIRGYEMGEGSRTALLIHGWAGSSRQYRRIARRLAGEGYRCVVVDLPAHGMEAGRSTDALEIAAALEAAGTTLGRVDIVVAHSLGALGTALAMRSSLRADRLVLVAPGLSPRHALDSFAEMLHLRPKVARAVERSMEQRFGDDLWERIPREVLDLTIPGRTLIIQDTDDDMIPIERTRALAERWGVELVTTRGHGHNGVLRAAEVIDRIAGLACMDPAPA